MKHIFILKLYCSNCYKTQVLKRKQGRSFICTAFSYYKSGFSNAFLIEKSENWTLLCPRTLKSIFQHFFLLFAIFTYMLIVQYVSAQLLLLYKNKKLQKKKKHFEDKIILKNKVSTQQRYHLNGLMLKFQKMASEGI